MMHSRNTGLLVSAHLRLKAKDCLCSQGSVRRQGQCLLYITLHNMLNFSVCIITCWFSPKSALQTAGFTAACLHG